MTNLVLAVILSVSTNWAPQELIYSNCTNAGCLAYHIPAYKEVGTVSENTSVVWTNGEKVVVESAVIKKIERVVQLGTFTNVLHEFNFGFITNEISKTR